MRHLLTFDLHAAVIQTTALHCALTPPTTYFDRLSIFLELVDRPFTRHPQLPHHRQTLDNGTTPYGNQVAGSAH